ncbi:MAG TPA: glycosyltransferase [Falsiroseomonas sp.]|nr:glycosyltransferase [Falsiroseomonas sp.]
MQHAVRQDAGHPTVGALVAPPPLRCAWQPSGFLLIELAAPPALPGTLPAGPVVLHVGGVAVAPPVASLALPGSTLVLARAGATCAAGVELGVRRDGGALRYAELGEPGPPDTLLRDRPAAEQLVLLRRLLAAASAFRGRSDPAFGALCQTLASALAAGLLPARALAGGGGDLVSVWRLPEAAPAQPGSWHLLAQGEPLRPVPAPEPGAWLLLLDGLPQGEAVLVPPEGLPMPLTRPASVLPGLLALARRGGAVRQALLDLLAPRARAAAPAATLLRDLQLLAPARATALDQPTLPVGGALELALPDGEGGVFLRGWLRDPLGLVRGMALRGPGGAVATESAALHRTPRPDLADRLRRAPQGEAGPRPGFLAHLPAAGLPPGTAQLGMELHLTSGQVLKLMAPPGLLPPATARDLVLAAADAGSADDALLDRCIAPAVARLQRAAMAPGPPAERIALGGAAPRRPAARIVVPLWRQLGFLRAQVTGFARDPGFRGATAPELVYVLDSPEQRDEAVALLGGLALLHGLALTLLVHDRNRGYASACNSGAAEASAPLLVFLNSDVVPEAPGWLAALRRRFARDMRLGAVGPKLLYPDGAIQHAGMFYAPAAEGGWGINHHFKGWPRDHAPACRARRVPAVTGAALAVRRPAFETAGGFCTDYVLGDFEDSDLCLKLHAAGHAIGYEPAAELVHHERQSIAAHPGHAGTLAAAYNRRLHAARWGEAIGALMRRQPQPRG